MFASSRLTIRSSRISLFLLCNNNYSNCVFKSFSRRIFKSLPSCQFSLYFKQFSSFPEVKITQGIIMGEVKSATLISNDFEVIMQGRANEVHEVTKYRSKSTGLEVVHAAIEGPIVNGYIVLATRAEDDDGLPHTLEHLIFMGSEEYPYKGVLDVLANKCFASGTNAWTDVDHTCYTLTTAGSEGFCRMLGIYMDHIFHPILSDSAFKTEVYHITGEGTDAGVVYSELQAKENTAEEKTYNSLVRTVYPPESGYHYQTGGILKNIRDSCNNEKVRDFHKKFYNPKNTCLIVCGTIAPDELFQALDPTIKKLNEKGVVKEWTKPWLEDVPEVACAIEKHVKFPAEEDEDEEALVTVGFRGPSAITEIEHVAALRLLFEYLTDSSIGPFQSEFVENDDPICSGVSYAEMENSRTTFYFEFEAAQSDKLNTILPTMRSTLEKQIKVFDMIRMKDIIKKNFQEELSSMENTPHNSVAYAVIGDFLYGSDDKSMFEKRINSSKTIKTFLEKPLNFWTDMIKERILDQKWVTVFASPSKEIAQSLAKEEVGRVEERILKLGEPGLTKLGYELEEAIKANSIPAPKTVLEKVSVPCTQSINFHSIKRYDNPDWASDLKCNFYLDDIKSNFVYVSVHMDTSSLSTAQRKYLAIFREVLVESPVLQDDGTLYSYEEVVADLNRTWLSYGCSVGIDGGGRFKCGSYSHQFALNCQMELNKLEQGFDWLRKLLWKTQWSGERTKVVATKMAGDVPQLKRKGSRMANTMLKDMLFKTDSNVKATSLVRQHKFLKEVGSTSEKKIKEMLESIRKVITAPENMTVHIATTLERLRSEVEKLPSKDLSTLLKKTFDFSEDSKPEKRLPNQRDTIWMKDISIFKSTPEQKILGNRAEDSSFLVQVVPGPTDFLDPELPLLLTAIQYFCQTEGPFYRGIRGAGFAYDFYMDTRCNEGLIYFNLYRCTDVIGAYTAAKEIVLDHLNGVTEWSDEYFSSAKSSLIFEYIEGEKTPLALASTSLCSYYRDVPEGYTRQMIQKISEIQLSELQPVAEKYLRKLFLEDFVCSIVCPQDKVVAIADGFKKIGKNLTVVQGLANSFLERWD